MKRTIAGFDGTPGCPYKPVCSYNRISPTTANVKQQQQKQAHHSRYTLYQDLARHCSIGYTVVQTLCTVSHSRAYTVSSVQLSLLQKRERERGRKQFPPAREFWHLTQGSVMQKDDSLAFTVFKKKEPFFFLSLFRIFMVTPNRPSTVYGMSLASWLALAVQLL